MWHFSNDGKGRRKNRAPKLKKSAVSNRKKQKFTGSKPQIVDRLPVKKLPDSLLLVGYLEELECETPLEKKVDSYNLLVNESGKKPLVCASGDGNLVVVLSADKLGGSTKSHKSSDIKKAISLHEDFHGTGPEEIKKMDTSPVDKLFFFGWLNYIVYDVPNYSERRGVPFIHEAKDRGDDVPPAKEKPIVCVSPEKDMIIMYGKEFEFTDRGIIG